MNIKTINQLTESQNLTDKYSICADSSGNTQKFALKNIINPIYRVIDNKLQASYDAGVTFEPVSDYISTYFRWGANNTIQISNDNKTWSDLSGSFTSNIFIKGYVKTTSELPTGEPIGSIYMVGSGAPYEMYVLSDNGWINNGYFQSIAAGIVQETGNSETEVMSQKAVTDKLSELESKVGEISKTMSPTITNIQIDGLLDSLDKIKSTYHDPILSLYDGGIKVSPTLDSSKPFPNIYLTDIDTSDKDETYLVLVDIYNIGCGLLQFHLGNNRYSAEVLDERRLVKTDIVTVSANQRTRFRLQSDYDENGYYIIYAVMVFKVPENIPSDEFQRNILNYYNTVGYKQSYGGAIDSEHSNTTSVANRLKVKDIELWGDSLTKQNYGKYISGANVSTHGFGGKKSSYIRDKFLSDADKKATQVIWVGRNNYYETDVIIDDIRDMVSSLKHNDFIIMCPPNGCFGEFGTNGENGNGEMKGGAAHSKFLELERRLLEEYPSNFLNIRKAVIEGWRMGNVRLLSDFTQPSVGSNVTIEVSDATFLTTYNYQDLDKFGQDFMSKIRIGVNGMYDVYKIVEKTDDTHLIVQLEESNRIGVGSTVGNIINSDETNSVTYLRVMQNADYMCWLYDTTLSTFRNDNIHMTYDGLKLVAQIVSRKLASMKLL